MAISWKWAWKSENLVEDISFLFKTYSKMFNLKKNRTNSGEIRKFYRDGTLKLHLCG